MKKSSLIHYRRIPAIAVIVAGFVLGLAYSMSSARARHQSTHADSASTSELEQMIASGSAPPSTWLIYGNHLYDAGDYPRAALAYASVIKTEPFNRPARFQYAMSLAKAPDPDRLFLFLRDQLYAEPKLAAELSNRPELRPFSSDARFENLRQEAAAQSMD